MKAILIFGVFLSSLAPRPTPLAPQIAWAEIPYMINYQGRLTDLDGSAVVGAISFTFRLYDAATAGTELWKETQSVTLSKDDNGIFNVVLGNVTAMSSVNFNSPMWLSVQVGTDAEMSPRQRMTAVGYAMNTDQLDSLDSSKFLRTDIDTSAAGKLTITKAGAAFVIKPTTDPSANTKMIDVQDDDGTSEFSVDSEGDVSIAGNLSVTGTISGSTSSTGTTNASWNIGSNKDATAVDISLLLGQASGQESLVFDGDSTDDFVLSDDLRLSPTGTAAGDTAGLRFLELAANGTNFTGFKAPDSLAGDVTYTLPTAAPTSNGQVLSSTTAGVLSWASDANSGGTVTSISQGTGMSFSVNPITTTGTINLDTASTLTHSGVWTLSGNWVNTANPWADNEVSDTLTASIFKGSGSTTDAVDLGTAEVSGSLGAGNVAADSLDFTEFKDSMVLDADTTIDMTSGATPYDLIFDDMSSSAVLQLQNAQSPADTATFYVADTATANAADLVITLSDGGLVIDTTGNVGIGTTNPAVKLDISGNARASRVEVDGATIYMDTSASDMTFTDPNAGTVKLTDLAGGGAGGSAPKNATYLVNSANAVLNSEVVVSALTADLAIKGDNVAARTLTLGQQVTNADIVNFDVPAANVRIGNAQLATSHLSDGANVAHINAAETLSADWVNTANPWADNEVDNDLTLASTKAGSFKPTTDVIPLTLQRGTDTSPTANLLRITDAAGTGNLFVVNASGQLTAGDVPWARLSSIPANLDTDATNDITTATSAGGDLTGTYPNPTIGTGKVTSTHILNDTILNADINASAGIVDTKLATISTAGKVADSALSSNVALLNRANQTFTAAQVINPGTTPAAALTLDIDALGVAGQRDSHNLVLTGRAYDTGAHNADWKLFNDVTLNTGASTLTIQSRIDAAAFANRLTLSDAGTLTLTGNLALGDNDITGGGSTTIAFDVFNFNPITMSGTGTVFSNWAKGLSVEFTSPTATGGFNNVVLAPKTADSSTVASFRNLNITNPTLGASSTITNNYGIYIEDLTAGSTKNVEIAFTGTTPVVEMANTGTLTFTDGTNTLLSLADAGTAGTLTVSGQLSASNLGIEFTESDTNPACAAGNFTIFADLSENKLKKCQNGSLADLDTTGAGGAAYSTIQEEGTSLTQRTTFNFIGAALTAADDAANTRTNVTLSASPDSASVVGTGRTLTGGTGVDIGGVDTAQDLSADRTLTVDTTELGTVTWLPNADSTWTFDIAAAGTNPTIGFSSGLITVGGDLTVSGGDATITNVAASQGLLLQTANSDTLRLDVVNTATAGAADATISTSDGHLVLSPSSGFVGIGTGGNRPDAPLTFPGTTGQKIHLFRDNPGYVIGVEASEFRVAGGTGASDFIAFRTGGYSGTERLRIDPNSVTLSNLAPDLTTATNEDLTLDAAGTGKTVVLDDFSVNADKKVGFEGSAGDTYASYDSTKGKVFLYVNGAKVAWFKD